MNNPDYVFEFKSPYCGDRSKFFVKVDDNGVITDASYEQLGCTFNCLIFEKICSTYIGQHFENLLTISKNGFDIGSDVPKSKKHCFDLVIETLSKGLNK